MIMSSQIPISTNFERKKKRDFFMPHRLLKSNDRGTWVAQSAKHPPLDFDSGHDLRVMRSSPQVRLSTRCGACLKFSLSLSLRHSPATLACSLSLSKK